MLARAWGQLPVNSPAVTLDAISASQPLGDGIQVQSGPAVVRIIALRNDIVRVRISPTSVLAEDASWAVLPESRTKSIEVQPWQDASSVGFRTAVLEVRIERNPFRIVIRDLEGNVISADSAGRPTNFHAGGFSVYKQMPASEHYFGLGDKTGTFDRREQAYTLWNTDVAPQESVDPLYKSIPFLLAIDGTRSYGIFLDNTWRTWFDFGKQARDAFAFGAEGGPLDYYFIYGPTPKQVVEGYAYLTGKPPLPPLWALGFQQSRYSYTPESRVREIAARLRTDRIPCDVVYLDIDFQDRNRPFTVNPKTFPNFPGLVSDLRKQHFRLVTITDLHIAHAPNQGYAPYDTGHAGDHFVKSADGSEFVGIVWPGPSVFPDFTRAQTRRWWGGLYQEFVKDGVAGFWNDMNEPSVFDGPGKTMPLGNLHRIEEPGFTTRTAIHSEIHNIVGLENVRATYEGLLQIRPDERPYAGYLRRRTTLRIYLDGRQCRHLEPSPAGHADGSEPGIERHLFRRRRCWRIQRKPVIRFVDPVGSAGSVLPVLPQSLRKRHAPARAVGPWPGAGNHPPSLRRDSVPALAVHLFSGR
jgi:alpha-glucosidase